MTYHIRCEVNGGVTGYRTALLKHDGQIVVFQSREEAIQEANRLNDKMNGPDAKASFSYSVEEGI